MYTHTHIQAKVQHPFCAASSPSLLHSEPPVAGSSGQWSAWWPAPLLVCWSSGNITFGALWRLWCWCQSSFSSCSPGSLPLQQVAVGMKRVQVHEQIILRRWRVAALLTHVQLVAALLVGVCLGDAVDLLHVGLQWAALGEGLLTESTLVWTDPCVGKKKGCHALFGLPRLCMRGKMTRCISTCVRAYMSLEVKGVVEAFPAEAAEVSLCLAVTFDVSVQHSLVVEDLLAHLQTAVAVNQTVPPTMVDLDRLVWHTWHTKDEFWFWAVDLVTTEASGGAELVFTAGTRWFVAGALEMGVCEEGAVTAGSSPVVTCEGNQ